MNIQTGEVVFRLPYEAPQDGDIELGVDTGLNQVLLRGMQHDRSRSVPFEAVVLRHEKVVIRGGWGLVHDSDGNLLIDLFKTCGWGDGHIEHARNAALEFPEKFPPVILKNPVLNLLWPGVFTYGHWLLDTIPRMHMLRCYGFDFTQCTALIPATAPFYMREILSTFGVKDFVGANWDRALICDEVYSPGHCRGGTAFPAQHYQDAFEIFRLEMTRRYVDPRGERPARRLYVHHTPLSSAQNDPRALSNEAEVAGWLTGVGFNMIDPLKYPFLEQISLFQQASAVVGIDSSALHNSIFSKRGCVENLVVFCPPWRFNYNHQLVASVIGARLTLLKGVESEVAGVFKVGDDGLEILRSMF